MTKEENQQLRRQSCAASPNNETFTPKERECWHLKRISQLLNSIRKFRSDYNFCYAQLQFTQEKLNAQRITLARMNVQAEVRNKRIAELEFVRHALEQRIEILESNQKFPDGSRVVDHTPTPQFDEARDDD